MKRRDNIRVWDLEICKNIQLLKAAQNLILYGAAEKGQEVLHKLQDAAIKVSCFCDSDLNKWGGKIEGIDIISPYTLEEYLARDNKPVYVIACVLRPGEIKTILNQMQCNDYSRVRFISCWGITTALHINRDIIYQKNCRSYRFGLLIEDRKIEAYKDFALNILKDYLINPGTVWLLQPGKTASTTLIGQLICKGIPVLRQHIIEYPGYILGEKYHDLWDKVIKERLQQKIKVIVAVREPISRDYSAFWNVFFQGIDMERGLYLPIVENDFQKYYEMYTELILSGNKCLKDKLGVYTPYVWGDEFEWIDDQIKKYLNVDVYDYPFDKEKGFCVIKKENVELFLYKVENIQSVSSEIERFVGVSELPQIRSNVSEENWYGLACEQFKQEVRLPREYVDHYYKGNAKVDHFYSKEEQQNFLKQWKAQIK